jgi:hypothetical protein
MQALRSEVAETARLLAIAGRMSLQDPEKLARLRSVIERTRKELNTLIYGDGSQQEQPTQSEQPPTVLKRETGNNAAGGSWNLLLHCYKLF